MAVPYNVFAPLQEILDQWLNLPLYLSCDLSHDVYALLQEILDQWLKCQGKWIYLEPIFGAEEIMKQIPKEGQVWQSLHQGALDYHLHNTCLCSQLPLSLGFLASQPAVPS